MVMVMIIVTYSKDEVKLLVDGLTQVLSIKESTKKLRLRQFRLTDY